MTRLEEMHPLVQAFVRESLGGIMSVSGKLPFKALHELRTVMMDSCHMLLDVEADRRNNGDLGEEPGKIQIVRPGPGPGGIIS